MGTAFLRQLQQEFKGYNGQKLAKDLMAGLTVAAVALPLALAFGVSAGATAACGLIGRSADKGAVDLAIGTHHRGRTDLYHHRFIRSRHTSNQSNVKQAGEKMIRFPPSHADHRGSRTAELAPKGA